MKTNSISGEVLPLTAPAGGVASGGAYLIGIVVIAAAAAAEGAIFEGVAVGVFDLPKPGGEAWTEGVKIYFDESEAKFTTDDDSAANQLVGVAVRAQSLVISTEADGADIDIDGDEITILDYEDLVGARVVVVVDGQAYVVTEGVHWTAGTSNDATAVSLAAAINGLDGLTAAAVYEVVTVGTTKGRVRLDGAVR